MLDLHLGIIAHPMFAMYAPTARENVACIVIPKGITERFLAKLFK